VPPSEAHPRRRAIALRVTVGSLMCGPFAMATAPHAMAHFGYISRRAPERPNRLSVMNVEEESQSLFTYRKACML